MLDGRDPATAVVTVERLIRKPDLHDGPRPTPVGPASRSDAPRNGAVPVLVPCRRERNVVRYPSTLLTGLRTHHDVHHGSRVGEPAGTVLVVDPTPSTKGSPGLAAQAAVATCERLGYRAEAVAPVGEEALDLTFHDEEIDLVLLVIGGEQASDVPLWAQSSWCVPAQLAAGYGSLGIDVLAVSAGAGAGALLSCYEQGATILFDFDELPEELRHRRSPRTGAAVGSLAQEALVSRLPSRFEALLQLTASERRVLFYLTTGKSAQEIADSLVVSLTTVRSHIRSILRKLGVRSQLAAVVLANSRDLGRIQPNGLLTERVVSAATTASRQNAG